MRNEKIKICIKQKFLINLSIKLYTNNSIYFDIL